MLRDLEGNRRDLAPNLICEISRGGIRDQSNTFDRIPECREGVFDLISLRPKQNHPLLGGRFLRAQIGETLRDPREFLPDLLKLLLAL